MYVCCMCVGGILCLTIERSSPPSCFLSDVVKKAILDAFQISEGKQCRLWHRYMTNSYKQVKGEQGQRQWHNTNGMQRSVESVREGLQNRKARLYACWFRMYFSPHVPALHLLSSLQLSFQSTQLLCSLLHFPPDDDMLQESWVFTGQLMILEVMNANGTWPGETYFSQRKW